MGLRRQVQQMHRRGRSGLGTRVLAVQVAITASCARLDLLALHASSRTGLTGVGHTAGAGGRVDAPLLGAIGVVVVVGTVSLEEIRTAKRLATDLLRKISNVLYYQRLESIVPDSHRRQSAFPRYG